MADRLSIIEWACQAGIPDVPIAPWETEESWRQLFRDTRALLVLLATTCDPVTGCVEYAPDRWAEALTIAPDQVIECVEQLCAFDLAFSDSFGNEDTYAVQLPDEVRSERVGHLPDNFPASHYAYRRYAIWTSLLDTARRGQLSPQWRQTLSVDNWLYRTERPPEDPRVREADQLIINELATMPPAAWEPFVADGDWRRALEAWHQAAIEVHDSFEVLRHDGRRAVDCPVDPTALPETGLRQSRRSSADAVYGRRRDEIEALYLAGLAAGCDEVDWVDWFSKTIQQWHDVSTRGVTNKTEMLLLLESPEVRASMQMLPTYWRTAQPQASTDCRD